MFAPTYKGHALGWHANYYFSSVMRNTWYLVVRPYYESYRSYPHAFLGYEDRKGFRSDAFFGFRWKRSRVNLMSGLGVEYRSHDVTEQKGPVNGAGPATAESRESGWGPMIEIRLGIEI